MEYNGIKIFDCRGYKLSDETEDRIEAIVRSGADVPRPTGEGVGRVGAAPDAAERYIAHVVASAGGEGAAEGLRVLLDCANGSASATAAELFARLGASCDVLHASPDGCNINKNCGSTHIDALAERMKAGGYDLGLAFDGDADRCLAVDEKGEAADGDRIIAALALHMKKTGALRRDTVVVTVLSNLGLHRMAREHGITVVSSAVGDRYVLEEMKKGGYSVGGEQSGHIIFGDLATTGDGQLTAAVLLSVLKGSGKKASELLSVMRTMPQVSLNVPVPAAKKESVAADAEVASAVARARDALGADGRVLVRPSGTESLVRVMLEGPSLESIRNMAEEIAGVIRRRV